MPQRLELVTRTERRRRWSAAQKRAIVAESLGAGSSVLATARKYTIGTGQLYLWRRQMRRGELAEADGAPMRFVRIDPPTAEPRQPGMIEIAMPQWLGHQGGCVS